MDINESNQAFLQKRAIMIKFWPYAAGIMLLLIMILLFWLYSNAAWLINPFETFNRLENQTLDYGTLSMMAAMVPILFNALVFILIALIILAFAVISNEKRYQKIIKMNQKKQ